MQFMLLLYGRLTQILILSRRICETLSSRYIVVDMLVGCGGCLAKTGFDRLLWGRSAVH